MTEKRVQGIYGILPADIGMEDMLGMAEAALRGGVKILQLRDKKQGFRRSLKRARALRERVRAHNAILIVNDSPALACEAQADGVHLGRTDMQGITAVRSEAGDGLLIGVSCKADAAFARHVLTEGANYVSFGAIFPTRSKQDAVPVGLPRLVRARQLFPDANICAVGGINLESLPAIRMAGADCAAVISELFGADDIESRARIMVETWNNAPSA